MAPEPYQLVSIWYIILDISESRLTRNSRGNISWGHATSKDMITWQDKNGWRDGEAVALGPTGNGSYNGLGIFSGTGQPVNLQGEQDGTLLIFYTSVQYLPTNWKIPYTPYTETQSMVYSTDGGDTWVEYENNPIIDATTGTEPMNWNITGFRDPFFEVCYLQVQSNSPKSTH